MRITTKLTPKYPDREEPVTSTAVAGKDGSIVYVGDGRIRKLLAELPVLPKMRDQIDDAAACFTGIIVSSSGRDFPKNESAGTQLILKELGTVGKLSAKLLAQLDRLHKESYQALSAKLSDKMVLDFSSPHIFERYRIDYPIEHLRGTLDSLHRGAKEMYFALARDKMIPSPRGPRPKHEAARITSAAAIFFERLTGRKVARQTDWNPSGEFHCFLENVFEIAAITINVDEQIRNLIASRKKKAMGKRTAQKGDE